MYDSRPVSHLQHIIAACSVELSSWCVCVVVACPWLSPHLQSCIVSSRHTHHNNNHFVADSNLLAALQIKGLCNIFKFPLCLHACSYHAHQVCPNGSVDCALSSTSPTELPIEAVNEPWAAPVPDCDAPPDVTTGHGIPQDSTTLATHQKLL